MESAPFGCIEVLRFVVDGVVSAPQVDGVCRRDDAFRILAHDLDDGRVLEDHVARRFFGADDAEHRVDAVELGRVLDVGDRVGTDVVQVAAIGPPLLAFHGVSLRVEALPAVPVDTLPGVVDGGVQVERIAKVHVDDGDIHLQDRGARRELDTGRVHGRVAVVVRGTGDADIAGHGVVRSLPGGVEGTDRLPFVRNFVGFAAAPFALDDFAVVVVGVLRVGVQVNLVFRAAGDFFVLDGDGRRREGDVDMRRVGCGQAVVVGDADDAAEIGLGGGRHDCVVARALGR